MSDFVITRRVALFGFGGLAVAGLSGCNTTQMAAVPAVAAGPAPVSGYRIANIVVDTGPLVAQSGNPTAQWAQAALPGALAQALGSHVAPGDPSGGTLSVVIDSIYLGNGGPGDADRIRGVATLNGQQASVHATSTYFPSPTDQTLFEQAFQNRVNALAVAFAYRLRRKLRQ
jgi:hypothetical protein